jgi:hypothetical protein
LRQLFFDQPAQLPALRENHAALVRLRQSQTYVDGGRLWDELLGHLQQYVQLLEDQQGEQQQQQQEGQQPHGAAATAAAAQEPFVAMCDLCSQPPHAGTQLRRMQQMGGQAHLAVCGVCAEQRPGQLLPLTPLWQLDEVRCVVSRLWLCLGHF